MLEFISFIFTVGLVTVIAIMSLAFVVINIFIVNGADWLHRHFGLFDDQYKDGYKYKDIKA